MEENQKTSFVIGKKNLITIGIGFLIVVFGFILMAGGKSENPEVFNPEVFSAQRITVAPIVVLIGYAVVGIGIMLKPSSTLSESNS
jgi:uncharacterized membrane protein